METKKDLINKIRNLTYRLKRISVLVPKNDSQFKRVGLMIMRIILEYTETMVKLSLLPKTPQYSKGVSKGVKKSFIHEDDTIIPHDEYVLYSLRFNRELDNILKNENLKRN